MHNFILQLIGDCELVALIQPSKQNPVALLSRALQSFVSYVYLSVTHLAIE
jgi:hypothetical protein